VLARVQQHSSRTGCSDDAAATAVAAALDVLPVSLQLARQLPEQTCTTQQRARFAAATRDCLHHRHVYMCLRTCPCTACRPCWLHTVPDVIRRAPASTTSALRASSAGWRRARRRAPLAGHPSPTSSLRTRASTRCSRTPSAARSRASRMMRPRPTTASQMRAGDDAKSVQQLQLMLCTVEHMRHNS
jgi:hypothetical protein